MKQAGSVFQVSRWAENGELNATHLRSKKVIGDGECLVKAGRGSMGM